jgi:VanZ family protein
MAEAMAPPLDRAVRRARWLLAGFTLAVVLVLFWPSRPGAEDQDALAGWLRVAHEQGRLLWLSFGLVEFSANVVMFVPLGALAALSRPRGGDLAAVAGCVAFSALAEAGQWLFLSARTADIRDVLANSLGAVIGVGVVALIRRRTTLGRA